MRKLLAAPVRRLVALTAGIAVIAATAFAGAAAAATAPAAITGPVTSIGPTTATVAGTVNPNGDATTWYAEYGKTTSYGSKTTSTSAGSGTANVGVSAGLTGLTAGTIYHYRIVATNTAGPTLGADGIFTTSAAPGAVTGAASNLAPTSATLNGTIDANGRATTYYFDYGKTTGYGSKTAAQSGGSDTSSLAVSASVSGLQTGQHYHFRVVAMSDAGTTQGADQSFTLLAAPTVTTNGPSSVSSSGARLNGSVNPNGQSTTYDFEYGTTTGYGSKTAAGNAGTGTSATGVSATLTGLTGSTTFHYRLVASNASGPAFGADQTITLAAVPSVQTGSAQGGGTTSVTLTGSVNPLGHSTSWYFEYGTTTGYGSKTGAKSVGSGTSAVAVSAPVSNLAPGTTYHYRLVASSSIGTSHAADVAFTTVAAVSLSAPSLEAVSGHFVTITGKVSSGQPGVSVTILGEPFGAGSFTLLGTVLTGAGGTWTYNAQPKIRTTYEANANGGTSSSVTIGVRPAATLRVITKGRITSRFVSVKSFAGRFVQLQRRQDDGRWRTVAKVRLNKKSSAIFHTSSLPQGASTIRIAMSVNQAGPGYLAGFSRTIVYRH